MSSFDVTAFGVATPLSSDRTALQLRDGRTVMVAAMGVNDDDAFSEFLRRMPEGDRPAQDDRQLAADPAHACGPSRPPIDRDAMAAWVREDGVGRMVGYASYTGSADRHVDGTLLVRPDWRRRGLASALFGWLVRSAAAQGFTTCRMTAPDGDASRFAVLTASGLAVRVGHHEGRCQADVDLTPTDTSLSIAAAREQASAAASLRPLLTPRSVAVIGASRSPERVGRRIFEALVHGGFGGRIVPVNPAVPDIAGRACHASIADVPGPIDLAVVAVPAPAVPGVLAECGRAGVRAVAVITSGFAEQDAAGRTTQDRMRKQALTDGMRMVGPNCMGVLNASRGVRLNASLAPSLPLGGGVSLASQSGGVALATIELATRRGLGFSTVVSLGNKADVSSNDLLLYGSQRPRDPRTRRQPADGAARGARHPHGGRTRACRSRVDVSPRRHGHARVPPTAPRDSPAPGRRARRTGACARPARVTRPRRCCAAFGGARDGSRRAARRWPPAG